MLTVNVVYRLREYLCVLQELAPLGYAAKRSGQSLHEVASSDLKTGLFPRLAIALVGTLAFAYKTRKVGPCIFRIDVESIRRDSRLGELVVPWADIRRVHRFSGAYLFLKEVGAMPLPYRCLTPPQRAELETLLAANGFAV